MSLKSSQLKLNSDKTAFIIIGTKQQRHKPSNHAKQDLSKVQRVQHCLARVVLRAPRFSPSLPLLKQLHWLPGNYRIKFKLPTLTYRALAIHQPPYLASLLHFPNIPRQLKSSTVEPLIYDPPHERPPAIYDHISCNGW